MLQDGVRQHYVRQDFTVLDHVDLVQSEVVIDDEDLVNELGL
jgi:hypothetical protein